MTTAWAVVLPCSLILYDLSSLHIIDATGSRNSEHVICLLWLEIYSWGSACVREPAAGDSRLLALVCLLVEFLFGFYEAALYNFLIKITITAYNILLILYTINRDTNDNSRQENQSSDEDEDDDDDDYDDYCDYDDETRDYDEDVMARC